MDWTQVSTIFGPNMEGLQFGATLVAILALIWTIRGVNKSDINSLRSEVRGDLNTLRSEIHSDSLALKTELRGWREDLHKESKDFHGRLCAIERERK